jgi:hypothetical protein
MIARSRRTLTFLVAFLALPGCATPPAANDQAAERQALSMLLPDGIEIIEPFTRLGNFDDDPEPDGIEVMLQAVNPLDSPCLMLVGTVRVELYEFIPATADHKGRQLEFWTVELTEPQHQAQYWNRVTQMYEFRLGIDSARVPPPADRYVLLVTYNSPLGSHVTDEFVLEPNLAAIRRGG